MQKPSVDFVNSLRPLLGDELPAFLEALRAEPARALRMHRDSASARGFAGEPVPWANAGFYAKHGTRPGASIEHFAGAFYLQEASAMLPAAVLDAQPGEKILDLCAAPGGKSTQLAHAMRGKGLLVSNEPEPGRARILAGNLERVGATNAVVLGESPAKLAREWPEQFDAVLVDAPCSGEGMFRRNPDARAEWSPATAHGCARRQREILRAAAKLVRPGGRLIYSTCTFNATENEDVIAAFLEDCPEFDPWDFSAATVGASQNGMLRLWPHRARGDGHFVARMRKHGEWTPVNFSVERAATCTSAWNELLKTAVRALPEPLDKANLRILGGRLYAIPEGAPEFNGIRVVSPGLALLRLEKNRVEPEHALAMALDVGLDMALREARLTKEQAAAFIEGQQIFMPGEPGWTLATYEGLPLGWGKRSGDALKNRLPKGLRRRIHDEIP